MYLSKKENEWKKYQRVELTEEEMALLQSKDPDDKQAQRELRERIKNESYIAVSDSKAAELTAFYNSVKPEIKEEEVYQLISINVDEDFVGILNCRINEKHKQIRFF